MIETEIAREDDGALVAKVTQTQAFHYPRAETAGSDHLGAPE